MENKFLELVTSPIMNTDHVYRYSGTKLVEPESLSTHIYETMMLGYMMIDHINYISPKENLNKYVYLEKALHHDLEESLTGDVARPLKYHNESVRYELQIVAEAVAKGMYDRHFKGSADMFDIWDNAKEGKEGYILKIADMLTVANKAVKEVSYLGNKYFLRVVKEVREYLDTLVRNIQNSPFDRPGARMYIKELLEDTIAEMNYILENNQDMEIHSGIYSNSILV